MPDNHLYYGDNLDVLRRYVKDEARPQSPPRQPPTRTSHWSELIHARTITVVDDSAALELRMLSQ